MGFEDVQLPVEIVIADAEAHAGLLLPVFVQGHAALEPLFDEGAVVPVAEVETGCGIAGDVQVGPSVVVEIGCDSSQPVTALGVGQSGLASYVCEGAIAVIVVERDTFRRQSARPAVHRNALEIAVFVLAGARHLLRIENQVMRDE